MYNHILLPIDLAESSSWERALPTAIQMCQATGAELHIMTVVPDYGSSLVSSFFPKGFEQSALDEIKRQMKAFVQEYVPDDVKVQRVIAKGTVYDEILRIADEINIDLIVMSAHRPTLEDYLLGPNAARVVRHGKCSVFVVRG